MQMTYVVDKPRECTGWRVLQPPETRTADLRRLPVLCSSHLSSQPAPAAHVRITFKKRRMPACQTLCTSTSPLSISSFPDALDSLLVPSTKQQSLLFDIFRKKMSSNQNDGVVWPDRTRNLLVLSDHTIHSYLLCINSAPPGHCR